MENLEDIFKLVDHLLRGKPADSKVDQLLRLGMTLVDWAVTLDVNSSPIAQSKREEIVAVAIKIHNKARNLPTDLYGPVRSVLKTAAAWMLFHFSKKTPAAICMILKLLSRYELF